MTVKLPDHIKTPEGQSEFRIKEKGSVFISITKNIEIEKEAAEFLNSLKKKYYDATHHCYSYKLANGSIKYSDDGEPNGTAGLRILNAQNHFEVTSLITVVVRYFGGTKLGVGPLGKAYYEAAFGDLSNCPILNKILHHEIIVKYSFEQSKMVHHFISKHSLIIKETIFEDQPQMICLLPSVQKEKFFEDISTLKTNLIVVQTDKSAYIIKSN